MNASGIGNWITPCPFGHMNPVFSTGRSSCPYPGQVQAQSGMDSPASKDPDSRPVLQQSAGPGSTDTHSSSIRS